MKVLRLPLSIFYERKNRCEYKFSKKASRICLFYNSALRRRTINPEKTNKRDFSSDFLIYYCYLWWKSSPHTGCHSWNYCVESIVVISIPWNPEQLSGMKKAGPLSSKGHLPSRSLGIIFRWHMYKYYIHFWHALNFNC